MIFSALYKWWCLLNNVKQIKEACYSVISIYSSYRLLIVVIDKTVLLIFILSSNHESVLPICLANPFYQWVLPTCSPKMRSGWFKRFLKLLRNHLDHPEACTSSSTCEVKYDRHIHLDKCPYTGYFGKNANISPASNFLLVIFSIN